METGEADTESPPAFGDDEVQTIGGKRYDSYLRAIPASEANSRNTDDMEWSEGNATPVESRRQEIAMPVRAQHLDGLAERETSEQVTRFEDHHQHGQTVCVL